MESERKSQVREYLALHRLLKNERVGKGLSRLGYIVSETSDHQPSALLHARDLLNQGVIEKIAIPDPHPPYITGFPGPDYCIKVLINSGVQKKDIVVIQPEFRLELWNTQTEFTAVAQYLKSANESSLLLISPWFHTLRSYLTAISEFKKAGLSTKVFTSNVELDPYEKVTHSQGTQIGSRRKIFSEEIQKCLQYKNLIPIDEANKIFRRDRDLLSR